MAPASNRSQDTNLDNDNPALKLEEDYAVESNNDKKKLITSMKKAVLNYKGVPC